MTDNRLGEAHWRSGSDKIVLDGFKFGMLLDIGTVCLFVLNTGAQRGFFPGWSAADAVVVVDCLYITLSGFGAAAVLKKGGALVWIRAVGAAELLFGADTAAGPADFHCCRQCT